MFESIVSYADLGDNIDYPVRTYSTGMISRLGFSIMVHVNADIMVIDEAISVGDLTFAEKSKLHFKQMAKEDRIVIIASHDLGYLESCCDRVIWLKNGKIFRDGDAKKVCSEYKIALTESIETVKELAEAGASNSQFLLAHKYKTGTDVEQNQTLYEHWLKKAADSGILLAQMEYAALLESNGRTDEAYIYFVNAARQGNSLAKYKISQRDENKKTLCKLKQTYELITRQGEPPFQLRYAELLLKTATDEKETRKSFEIFQKLADMGDSDAQYQVAIMFRDGVGTQINYYSMEKYLLMASDNGHVGAITLLADTYVNGYVLPKNETNAFNLYLRGAMLGNSQCMYQVATMLELGIGTPKNSELSKKWFNMYSTSVVLWYITAANEAINGDVNLSTDLFKTDLDALNVPSVLYQKLQSNILNVDKKNIFNSLKKQAELGSRDARLKLAFCYEQGLGTLIDYTKAIEMYKLLSSQGDAWCEFKVGELYKRLSYSPENIKKSMFWFEKSGLHGYVPALSQIIVMYPAGNSRYQSALNRLERLADGGNADAMVRLAMHYDGGPGCDYAEARRWYSRSAEAGNTWSMQKLAEFMRDGKGGDVDIPGAINLFHKSGDLGNINSLSALIATVSSGPNKDDTLVAWAIKRMTEIADGGNADAMVRLAMHYDGGPGCDYAEARRWYSRSAEAGNTWSMQKLINLYLTKEWVVSEKDFTIVSKELVGFARRLKTNDNIEKNIDKAIVLYRKATIINNSLTNEFIDCLLSAKTVQYDKEAFEICMNNANGGDPGTLVRLSWFYRDGRLVKKDLHKALELVRQAYVSGARWAFGELMNLLWKINSKDSINESHSIIKSEINSGNTNAYGYLGKAYLYGIGVEKDDAVATKYLKIAASANPVWLQDIPQSNHK